MKSLPCYMMATQATHKTGDISSDEPDLCYIEKEDGDNYVGHWVTGFGFINVEFPKETTRKLTGEEIAHYNEQYIHLGDNPAVKLKAD